MFIHVGEKSIVRKKDIIGIFDIENTSVSAITREFLNRAGRNGKVIYVNEEMPKSFILVKDGEESVIYISSLAPSTLVKRYNERFFI